LYNVRPCRDFVLVGGTLGLDILDTSVHKKVAIPIKGIT